MTGHSIVYDTFGSDVTEQLACGNPRCGKRTRLLRFSELFHMAPVSGLVSALARPGGREKSVGALLRELDCDERPCDEDAGGCGKAFPLQRALARPPPVFTLLLIWETAAASGDDIEQLLRALEADGAAGGPGGAGLLAPAPTVQLKEVFQAVEGKCDTSHRLTCMMAYYGEHWAAFVLRGDKWQYFDDSNVRVVGSWADVKQQCVRGRLAPLVLFYQKTQ